MKLQFSIFFIKELQEQQITLLQFIVRLPSLLPCPSPIRSALLFHTSIQILSEGTKGLSAIVLQVFDFIAYWIATQEFIALPLLFSVCIDIGVNQQSIIFDLPFLVVGQIFFTNKLQYYNIICIVSIRKCNMCVCIEQIAILTFLYLHYLAISPINGFDIEKIVILSEVRSTWYCYYPFLWCKIFQSSIDLSRCVELWIVQSHADIFKLRLDVVGLCESCIELPYMLLVAVFIDEGDCFIVKTFSLQDVKNFVQPPYLHLLVNRNAIDLFFAVYCQCHSIGK